ncbi:MAG: histidine phosphatase family protein [Synergistaceae bacterium]|nr:histidine phosphatase family protein [Synergistaceae bacterium]MBQ9403488.1 histidine phosphatase family protein [Synergistaceae bacterium]MBQ9595007.1 histidine phosphatase family protein [Synergistaceae bacterium]
MPDNEKEGQEPRRVIFARHGQTEWNKEYRFQGRTNVKLTDTGKQQAESLAERLSSWPIEIIYTSPLDRALYTARAIAKRHNLEPVILHELQEINFAGWEGQSITALEKEQHDLFARWRADPFFNPPEGAETWEKIYTRLSRAVKIFLDGNYKRIAVISHGGIMRALYAVFTGLNPHKVWNMDVSNCAMSGVEMRHGRPCLVFANDDLHIRAGLGKGIGEKLPVWGESYEFRSRA